MKYDKVPKVSISQINNVDNTEYLSANFIITNTKNSEIDNFENPGRFDGGAFGICLTGTCTVVVNLNRFQLMTNDMLIITPGAVIQFIDKSEDFTGYLIGFSISFIKDIDFNSLIPFYSHIIDNPLLKLDSKQSNVMLELCELIRNKTLRLKYPFNKEVIINLFMALFYEVCAIYEEYKTTSVTIEAKKERILKKVRQLINFHYQNQRSVKFYAEELCLTPKYLSSLTKQLCGKTVGDMIDEAVILKAKIQLRYSEMSIQEISDFLNFPNPSFFSKYFKHRSGGISPMKYRKFSL